MQAPPDVFFSIPLMARQSAHDWSRVVHQLEATLGSIFRQTDPHFRVLVACHDIPELSTRFDERLEFLKVPYPPVETAAKGLADGGRKRARIARRIRQLGGGYVALADADDLVSNRLVAFVRDEGHPNGYLIERGYLFDATRGQIAPFPFPDWPAPFDAACATSVIVRYSAEELPDGSGDDCRYRRLDRDGHPAYRRYALAEGRPLLAIPFRAAVYVKGTGENLSHEAARNAPRDVVEGLTRGLPRHAIARSRALDEEFNLTAAVRCGEVVR